MSSAVEKAEKLHAESKRLLEIQRLREEVNRARIEQPPHVANARAASRRAERLQTEASQQAELGRLRRELEQARAAARNSRVQPSFSFGDLDRRAASFLVRFFARVLPMERAVPAATFAIRACSRDRMGCFAAAAAHLTLAL